MAMLVITILLLSIRLISLKLAYMCFYDYSHTSSNMFCMETSGKVLLFLRNYPLILICVHLIYCCLCCFLSFLFVCLCFFLNSIFISNNSGVSFSDMLVLSLTKYATYLVQNQ